MIPGAFLAETTIAEVAEATAAPGQSVGGGFNWTVAIIISVVVSLGLAIFLAVRKANKIYGKDL